MKRLLAGFIVLASLSGCRDAAENSAPTATPSQAESPAAGSAARDGAAIFPTPASAIPAAADSASSPGARADDQLMSPTLPRVRSVVVQRPMAVLPGGLAVTTPPARRDLTREMLEMRRQGLAPERMTEAKRREVFAALHDADRRARAEAGADESRRNDLQRRYRSDVYELHGLTPVSGKKILAEGAAADWSTKPAPTPTPPPPS